jgi:hypothetical protein
VDHEDSTSVFFLELNGHVELLWFVFRPFVSQVFGS